MGSLLIEALVVIPEKARLMFSVSNGGSAAFLWLLVIKVVPLPVSKSRSRAVGAVSDLKPFLVDIICRETLCIK